MRSKNFSKPAFTIYTGVSGKKITLGGDMFRYRTDVGLYLSSNSFDGSQKFYDLYSGVKSVSALNPPFSAYPLSNYTVNTNNSITFEIPVRSRAEKLDIIYANPAGYIRASQLGSFTYIQVLTSKTVQNAPLPWFGGPPPFLSSNAVVFTPKPVKITETISSYNVIETTSKVTTSIDDILLDNFIKIKFLGITRNIDGTKNVKLKINSKTKNIITLYVNSKPYSTFIYADSFDTTIYNLPRFGTFHIYAIDQKRIKSNDIRFRFSGGNKTQSFRKASTDYPDYPDYPYPTSTDYPDYPDYPYPTSTDYPDYPDYPYPTNISDYPDYPDYPYPTSTDYPDYPDYPYPTDISDYPDYPDYPYPTDINDYPDYPDYPYPTDINDYPDYPDYPYPTDIEDYPDYPDYPYPTDIEDYPDYPDYPYPTDIEDYPDYPDYPYPTDINDYPDYPDYPYPTDIEDYPDYPYPY